MKVNIHPSWATLLSREFEQPYFMELVGFLKTEILAGKIIYPPGSMIFNAFNACPSEQLKVVIIGQDPYHGIGQAHGLSFSVQKNQRIPPSLKNIYKEIQTDIGINMPQNYGDLSQWAAQGVLMLNSVLTVRANEPASHAKIGWQNFTDAVIKIASDELENVVFLLWGKFAHGKQDLIDETRHKVLKAAHPSPFAADKGFFGCKHFSKTNEYLTQHKKPAIDWLIKPE